MTSGTTQIKKIIMSSGNPGIPKAIMINASFKYELLDSD